VVDLEIQVLIRELAELMRRCNWEAATAGVSAPQRCLSTSLALVERAEQYEASLRLNENDQSTPLQGSITESDLLTAAKELEANALRYDLVVEKQPTSNRAHVYWRRPPPGPLASGRTQIRAGMVLRNRAETNARTVFVYALAVAGIAYLLACLTTESLWPFSPTYNQRYAHIPSPEAVIVILLLVPGFLYTRLELPEHNSVASHLRTVPRLVAYLCIVSTAVLAASVAASMVGSVIQIGFIIGTTVPIISTFLLALLGYQQSSVPIILARLGAPRWATCESAGNVRPIAPDVTYRSLGDST
jgi:hypothetical protein